MPKKAGNCCIEAFSDPFERLLSNRGLLESYQGLLFAAPNSKKRPKYRKSESGSFWWETVLGRVEAVEVSQLRS